MNELSTAPTLLRCSTTADFLAALPRLTGFTASNSLFVVFFTGSQAREAVRIDLPPDDTPASSFDFLDGVMQLIAAFRERGSGDAPALVLTTDERFSASAGLPRAKLARRIERRLRREGVRPREFCVIAADGWERVGETEPTPGGRRLEEIQRSPVAGAASAFGDAPPSLEELGEAAPATPRERAAVRRALDAFPPHPAEPEGRGWISETAAVVRTLCHETAAQTPSSIAQLVRAAEHSDRWLQLALGILTRPEFADEVAIDIGRDQFVGVPIDTVDHRSGWSIRHILEGASIGPLDRERLERVCDRLAVAIARTPETHRSILLTVSSWVWWLRGNQSVAIRHIERARSADPRSELTAMVERLISAPVSLDSWRRFS